MREQSAQLEVAITEAVETLPPHIEYPDPAITRDQREHEQRFG